MVQTGFSLSSGRIHIDRRYEYAQMLVESGDIHAAIELLEQTREEAASWAVLPFTLGKLYAGERLIDKAIDCFRQALLIDPADHQGAMLEMEILGTPVIGDAMPPAFVETLFDQYASRFDAHLTEALDYSVPQIIADMIWRHCPDLQLDRILDLGCGTGLAAERFAAQASWIEGVDLSGGMLEQARQKGFFHRLEQGDLLAHLQNSPDLFDLIIAADVLIYFGGLENALNAIEPRMDKSAAFVFSVQQLVTREDFAPDYHIGDQHRFSHNTAYLQRAITAAGLAVLACEEHVLRKDRGEDVIGQIYICVHKADVAETCDKLSSQTATLNEAESMPVAAFD